MMLRGSIQSDSNVRLESITDPNGGESGILHGEFLVELVDAVHGKDTDRLSQLRERGLELIGPGSMIDAIAVLSSFNAITRIADAIGIPLDDQMADGSVQLREAVGINRFADGRGINLPADLSKS